MTNTLSDRLSLAMQKRGVSQADLMRAAGVKSSSVSGWISGKTKSLKASTALTLAQFLCVPVTWLVGETRLEPNWDQRPEDGRTGASSAVAVARESPATYKFASKIPQFGTGGKMGHGLLLKDQPGIIREWDVLHEWLRLNVRGASSAENLCIVTGFGDSMAPLFRPGDPVIIDLGVREVLYDAVYFFRVGNEGYIKRLQRIPTSDGLRLLVKSDNPTYQTWEVTRDMDFEVFGRALKAWSGTEL